MTKWLTPWIGCAALGVMGVIHAAGADAPRASSHAALSTEQRESTRQEIRQIISLLESYHYRSRPLVQIDAGQLLRGYLELLDPQRLLFLASDEQFVLRRFGRSLKSSYLLSGDIYPAFEIFDLFRERFDAYHAWTLARLRRPLDLERASASDFVAPSPIARPARTDQAEALWDRALVAEVIEQMLETPDEAEALERVRERHRASARRVAAIQPTDIQEMFLNVVLRMQDPHSGYHSRDSVLELETTMTGSLVGIGANLRRSEGHVVIDSLIPGGAAEASGLLRTGDRIVAVANDEDAPLALRGLTLREVVQRLRGRADTKVSLWIETPDENASRRQVTLMRMRIQSRADRASAWLFEVPRVDAVPGETSDAPSTLPETIRIGVLRLPVFYGETIENSAEHGVAADVAELLAKLQAEGAAGIVLDLRNNPGGLVGEATRIAGLFINTGPVMLSHDPAGRMQSLDDTEAGVAFSGPLIALTSPQSASASELVSGALQCYGRAIVVGGESTFGKGTAQRAIPLNELPAAASTPRSPEWGELRLTGEYFYLPNGHTTQVKGVPSDIVLPAVYPSSQPREQDLPGALPWRSVPVEDFDATKATAMNGLQPVTPELLDSLRAQSAARVQTLPEFEWLRRAAAFNSGLRAASEAAATASLTQRRERRAQQTRDRHALQREKRELASRLAWNVRTFELDSVRALEGAHAAQLRARLSLADDATPESHYANGVYHQWSPNGELARELRVTNWDFAALEDEATALAEAFSAGAGVEVSPEQMAGLLGSFARKAATDVMNWEERFAKAVGLSRDQPAFRQGVSSWCARVVELNPTLSGRPPLLDVTLRESLRIAADWVAHEAHER